MSRPIEEMTLDEKIDEILKYQRSLHTMAIIRGIIGFALFMILVVLPLIGFYYWFQSFGENFGISLSEAGDTLQNIQNLKDIEGIEGVDDIRGLLEQTD